MTVCAFVRGLVLIGAVVAAGVAAAIVIARFGGMRMFKKADRKYYKKQRIRSGFVTYEQSVEHRAYVRKLSPDSMAISRMNAEKFKRKTDPAFRRSLESA